MGIKQKALTHIIPNMYPISRFRVHIHEVMYPISRFRVHIEAKKRSIAVHFVTRMKYIHLFKAVLFVSFFITRIGVDEKT
jgi:hypothetical protein